MINLLPPDQKRQIRAGQSNVLLLRYCILSLLLAGLLLAVIGAVYLLMNSSKETAEITIQDSVSKSQKYQKVKQDAASFTKNLTTAKTILDKEVHYSKIAVKIAQVIPSGIVLESLQLDAKTFGTPSTFNATGRSYNDGIRLKTAFEQSDIFKDVRLQSVSTNEKEGSTSVSIVISATIDPKVVKP